MNLSLLNYHIAEFFARCFVAILFIFQGYDKLFIVKIKNVIGIFQTEATKKEIPKYLIVFISYFTSITEFFGGLLLLMGLFHQIVSVILAVNLLVVTIAFSVLKPVWDLQHVFPRFVILLLVILLSNYFYFGLDTIFYK